MIHPNAHSGFASRRKNEQFIKRRVAVSSQVLSVTHATAGGRRCAPSWLTAQRRRRWRASGSLKQRNRRRRTDPQPPRRPVALLGRRAVSCESRKQERENDEPDRQGPPERAGRALDGCSDTVVVQPCPASTCARRRPRTCAIDVNRNGITATCTTGEVNDELDLEAEWTRHIKQCVDQLITDNRSLDERLEAAKSNLRFQDPRIADLEARLAERPRAS